MPLPTDEKLLAFGEKLLDQFAQMFGEHPGFRPAHAKGTMLRGTFVPSATASDLSAAQHFNQDSTPVLVRLSDTTGLPLIPDTDPNSTPKGIAVRFSALGERVHTDIVSHSTDGFPARTGEEFLDFLRGTVLERSGQPGGIAAGSVPRVAPRGAAVCPDADPAAGQFRAGDVLRRDGDEVHQRSRQQPVRPVPDHPGGRKPLP